MESINKQKKMYKTLFRDYLKAVVMAPRHINKTKVQMLTSVIKKRKYIDLYLLVYT